MKSLLMRHASFSVLPDSPKISLSRRDSLSRIASADKITACCSSPKISMHLDHHHHRQKDTPIRRALSETDLMKSDPRFLNRSFPAIIPEEECNFIPLEELVFNGGGYGKGKNYRGGNGGHNNSSGGDLSKIGEHYKEMLKSNPNDALLLRNYGKFLHEVEGDMEKAEEYYGRAILENPGDGEVLALYGKLIWEAQKDEDRANAYFHQAVSASPDDCMVLGSYAHFMWEAEDDEEEELSGEVQMSSSSPMVAVV